MHANSVTSFGCIAEARPAIPAKQSFRPCMVILRASRNVRCCRKKAERTGNFWRVAISGTKPPSSQRVPRSASVVRGRDGPQNGVAMPTSVHLTALAHAPFLVRMSPTILVCLWTVRFHARSHARKRHGPRSSTTPPLAFPQRGPCHYTGAGRTSSTPHRQSHNFNHEPRSGLAQAQPAGIYRLFL
jgi:hypothetical protein